ncbi:O-antigen polymerase [Microbacterium sp. NPDC055910]|uniref:O-antigen polymerase n=1 Tax=Microbacterium sp. NPDC055910 TaxID=3345659 RepID=UPI0035DE39F2
MAAMTRLARGARLSEVRQGGAPLVALYLILLWIVAPLLIVVLGSRAYSPLAVNLGVALAALVVFEMRRVGHPLTAAGIAALGGILIFAFRPLTIASSGTTTPGALLDTREFAGAAIAAGSTSLWQVTVFYGCFGAMYFAMLGRPTAPVPSRLIGVDVVRRSGVLLVFVALFAVACALLLIQTSGGFEAHFSGVSVRSSFLAGRYYLTLSYIPFTVALALYILARRHAGLKEWTGSGISAALLLCAVGFATGGRGPLLLGVIIPILILKQTGPSRFSPRALALTGLALLVGAMVMSLFLREGNYDEGASIRALQDDPVGTLLQRLTSGAETRPFDSLILLNEQDAAGHVPWLLGSTYAAVPSWFIPGDIAPWKDGGANTWFTRTYVPRFYYPDQIETSVSAIGEAFANFRWAGIVVVGVLVAIAAARLALRREGNGYTKTLLATILTPLFFSFIRGDAFQNLSTVILMLLCVALFSGLTGAGRPSSTKPSGHHQPWSLSTTYR